MAPENPRAPLRFGRTLRARRKALGMSQEALAEAARVSSSYVSQLERGRRSPTLHVLESLARGLGVTVADLLEDPEP